MNLPREIAVPGAGDHPLAARANPEPAHAYRSPFLRDIGRILHARAFRRLAGKTQVFTRLPDAPPLDHFRSRLTHTLEVAQIARTAASALGLNAELAEALALSHDIGHPPFGHAGERALDRALHAHGLAFDHNLHALRIVTWFEERNPAFRGLNLTLAVREGIVKHSRDYSPAQHPELAGFFLDQFPPLEAQLIDLADEIAYLTADLEDGLYSGILSLDDVLDAVPIFRAFYQEARRNFPNAAPRLAARDALRRMLDALVTDMLHEVTRRVLSSGIQTLEDVRNAPARLVALSEPVEAIRASTKAFLYDHLYNSPELSDLHAHAEAVVEGLFEVLLANPALLPEDHQEEIQTEGLARTVADYIAGMTDSYIQQMWSRHTQP
jgi:dGTPase